MIFHGQDSLHFIKKDSLHFNKFLPDSAVIAHLDSIFKNPKDSNKFFGANFFGNKFKPINNKNKPDSIIWHGFGKDSLLVRLIDSLDLVSNDSSILQRPKNNKPDSVISPVSTINTTTGNNSYQATSIISLTDNKLNIYPNPVSDFINLESSGIIKSYEIYTFNGKLISTNFINANQYTIQLSGINNGIYLLKVYSSAGIINKSFVVRK